MCDTPHRLRSRILRYPANYEGFKLVKHAFAKKFLSIHPDPPSFALLTTDSIETPEHAEKALKYCVFRKSARDNSMHLHRLRHRYSRSLRAHFAHIPKRWHIVSSCGQALGRAIAFT